MAVKEKSNIVMTLVTSGIKYCCLGTAQTYFDIVIKFSVICFSPKKVYSGIMKVHGSVKFILISPTGDFGPYNVKVFESDIE